MTNSPTNWEVNDKTIEAFHLMWDSFPHPVMLLQKCRDIVAINKTAEEMGRPTTGQCFQRGGATEVHRTCKANQAIEEGIAQRSSRFNESTNLLTDAYWLPLLSEQDLYLHFAIRTEITRESR